MKDRISDLTTLELVEVATNPVLFNAYIGTFYMNKIVAFKRWDYKRIQPETIVTRAVEEFADLYDDIDAETLALSNLIDLTSIFHLRESILVRGESLIIENPLSTLTREELELVIVTRLDALAVYHLNEKMRKRLQDSLKTIKINA